MSSGQSYDGGKLSRTYRFPAAAVASAAVFGRIQGPAGKRGRVRGIEYVVTTSTTVAASTVTVGNNGAANPASLSIPVATAPAGGAQSAAEFKANGDALAGRELAADTLVEVASDGGSTAGAADVIVSIDWF